MLNSLRIKNCKNRLVNLLFFHNMFSSSKTKQLIKILKQQLTQNRLSAQQNHNHFIQLINDDISNNNYDEYTNVKLIFESYVKQITGNKKFNEYNPKVIKQQGIRISEIMKCISNYPKFQLQKQSIRQAYQIFCRYLNQKTSQQLSKALLFSLKVDKRAQESVLYNQFLRFYLDERWETLKAKYQLNLKSESIGNFIKKILGSITHRGFLRRSPNYDRILQVCFPTQVLIGLIRNPSTNESLMIRKVMFQKIFTPMVNQFQNKLHSNLYNSKNTQLWDMLNKNIHIIFSGNKLVQKQCEYLRQLYATLFLVLVQKQQHKLLRHNLPQVCTAYGYIKQNYDSKKSKQFVESVDWFVKQFRNCSADEYASIFRQKIRLDESIFNMAKYFPELADESMKVIAHKISPLTFSVYFSQLCTLLPSWNADLITKICSSEQNIFNYITFQQCASFITQIAQNSTNPAIDRNKVGLYYRIVDSIVNREYRSQPKIADIVTILQIYQYHKQLAAETVDSNLQMLRLFLFRFVSDNKNLATKQQLQDIITIVLDLDDSSSFADEQGNYELNIYQELASAVDGKFVYTELKDRLKTKANIKEQGYSAKMDKIKEYLSRVAK